ncbi:toxin VasX [Pseudomonas sp. FME51]|uniref:toxin VasX n=1 Tax=Pseudomonas sp. FME51 TaxID=2742609 RepID=UPI0018685FCC|nr:toxin VasX [Pseudomonas sp. FME51]
MSNLFSLGGGAACEPAKLIIQVVGKDHPDSQRLVIYDEQNLQEQEWLTQQDKPEIQTNDTFSSVLHVWDWEDQPKRNLWLEIAAVDGMTIRVPLLDALLQTPRQREHHMQWNQIVPIVPMTALPGSKSEQDLGAPVLLRSGYLYVFYQDKLWRELEVRVTEDSTTYHDIDVSRYRRADGFRNGVRRATGVALEDIWLPAQWNNFHEASVQMCFSEVQLNAVRLQRLEQDNSLRRSRCHRPDLRTSKDKLEKLYKDKPDGLAMLEAFSRYDFHDAARRTAALAPTATRLNIALHAFPVTLAAPQRTREPGYEWLLDHPARYICDLSGAMPATALDLAKAFLNSCENSTPATPDSLLETSALASCLDEHLANTETGTDREPSENPTSLWSAQPSEADALLKVRDRQLTAVLLEDPAYRLRHLKQRIEEQQELLRKCIQRTSQHPHHGSALLIQQMVVPQSIGGQRNPLHASLAKINEKGKADINHFTAIPERMLVWQHLSAAQQLLSACLDSTCVQQALADHLSLDNFEYLAELHFVSQLIPLLVASPTQLDTLATNGRLTDAVSNQVVFAPQETPGQRLVSRMANEATHPLHNMLWPDVELDSMMVAYQKPAEPNRGDGRFRPDELAQFENTEAPESEPETLNAAIMAGLLRSGSLSNALVANAKAGANALHQIHANLIGAVDAAQRVLNQARDTSSVASQEVNRARQQHTDSQDELARAGRDRQAAEQAHRQAQNTQQRSAEQAQQRTQQLGQAQQAEQSQRSALASDARTASLRLHGMGVEQLRGMLRESFGEAVFIRRAAASAGTHYLFGLDDLPVDQQRPVRMYGEYLDGQGNPLASTNQRMASRAGLSPVAGDYLVLALPRTHKTAKAVRQLNQAVIEVMQAEQSNKLAQNELGRASAVTRRSMADTLRARLQEAAHWRNVQTTQSAANTAQQNLVQARSGLQEAADSLQKQQGNLLFRALNGKVFPASVMILELYNLALEREGNDRTLQEKGKGRAAFGMMGASLDLIIAMEALTYKMAGNNSVLAITRAPLFIMPELSAIRWLGAKLGVEVVRDVTARLIGQAAAALLMIGICLYDVWYAWRWNDDAMWGYLLMASGAAVGVVGGFFIGGSALLGPAGWAALLLIGTGAGIVYWLSSTPLEDWLGNGPFGDNTKYPHLQNPDEAFYRLLGLFAGPTVRIETNPLYDPNAKLLANDPVPYVVKSANTVICIDTHLPGLLGSKEGGSVRAECFLHRIEIPHIRGYAPRRDIQTIEPSAQITWPGSLQLFVTTPATRTPNGEYTGTSVSYEWHVRFQARLELPDDTWIFPAPSPKAPQRNAASQAFSAQPAIHYPVTAVLEL